MRWSDFVHGYGNATAEEVREAMKAGGTMDTSKLIYVTDQSHPDFHVLIGRWRQVDAFTVEYRDGGVWSRLHVSQFSLVSDPAEA